MKKTLTDLWNGQTALCNEKADRQEEISQLLVYLDRHYCNLKDRLNEQGRETLEKYQDCHLELVSIECENAFAQGFSLAVKLMAEAMVS